MDTHHHADALDTNSGTHRTGQPSNTLDIRTTHWTRNPPTHWSLPITNTNDHPADALVIPPPGCIGQANRATHWTCQPHWTHHHLNDAFDHPKIIPTPHSHDTLPPMLPLIPVPRRAEATRGPRAPAPRKCFTASPRAARPRWFRILEWLDARRIFTTVCESKRPKSKKKECNTRTSHEVTHPSTTLAQARLTSEF